MHPNIINFLACCTLKYAIYFSHQLPWNSKEKNICKETKRRRFKKLKQKSHFSFSFVLFALKSVKRKLSKWCGKSNKCEISKKKSISRLYVLHQHFHNVCKFKIKKEYLRFLRCVPRILILKITKKLNKKYVQ